MSRLLSAALSAFLLLLSPPPAAAQSYPPKDAGAADASFAAFREKLRTAAAAEDAESLAALTSPRVKLSFGGDEGRAALRRRAQEPEFWSELRRVLATPAGADGSGGYAAPYWHLIEHQAAFDPFETYFVPGEAMLRGGPAPDAKVLRLIRHVMVRLAKPFAPAPEGGVVEVELEDGSKGYAARSALISVLDYRAGFAKGPEGWRLQYFLAGD